MPVLDLSVALSCGDHSDAGSTSASLATDDNSRDIFVGDTHKEMEPDELKDRLHDRVPHDRCWGRLWKAFCDFANMRQWETIGHAEIPRLLPAAQKVLSTSHPDAAIYVSGDTPWLSLMTGCWEQFLVDTLHVQDSLFVSPWSAVTTPCLSPVESYQDLGALPVSALQDVVAHGDTVYL